MADQNKSKNEGLDRPKGVPGSSRPEDPAVFVMPQEFYGAPVGPAKPTPEPVKPAVPPPTPVPEIPRPVPKSKQPAKSGKSFTVIVIALVVVLLLSLGAAVYFLFFSSPPAVCGNEMCERGESYASCPSDCEPPPAVCGNDVCENAESYLSCPTDCPQPENVCGDGQCGGGETVDSCPADCLSGPTCGNGSCEDGEAVDSCPADCSAETVPANDSDSDGISDIEETSIYGSDPNRANSDGDSFVDLNEILNLFDPVRKEPARLADNPGIGTYQNLGLGLEMLYPDRWQVAEETDGRSVTLTSRTGEAFEVALFTKDSEVSLSDWMTAQTSGVPQGSRFERSINRRGYEQATFSDRQTVLISDGTNIALLHYDLNGQSEIRYRVTLAMMSNSLVFLEPVQGEETDDTVLPVSEGAVTEG